MATSDGIAYYVSVFSRQAVVLCNPHSQQIGKLPATAKHIVMQYTIMSSYHYHLSAMQTGGFENSATIRR